MGSPERQGLAFGTDSGDLGAQDNSSKDRQSRVPIFPFACCPHLTGIATAKPLFRNAHDDAPVTCPTSTMCDHPGSVIFAECNTEAVVYFCAAVQCPRLQCEFDGRSAPDTPGLEVNATIWPYLQQW